MRNPDADPDREAVTGAARPSRFVTDASLAFLARRLRFLGYDVIVAPGARLEEVFEIARADDRIVLTTSGRHPRRFAAVSAEWVPRSSTLDTLRALSEKHTPAGLPFSRCAECNTALQKRHPLEASGEVPGPVLRRARSLSFCPGCGKWYWDGSHVARLRLSLTEALGRPIA